MPVEFAYVLRPAFDQAFMERATERELRVFEEHGEWLEAGFAEGPACASPGAVTTARSGWS